MAIVHFLADWWQYFFALLIVITTAQSSLKFWDPAGETEIDQVFALPVFIVRSVWIASVLCAIALRHSNLNGLAVNWLSLLVLGLVSGAACISFVIFRVIVQKSNARDLPSFAITLTTIVTCVVSIMLAVVGGIASLFATI